MAELTQASLNLTPEERRAYGYLFQQADTEGLGVVPGDVAVSFFEKTKLDSTVLGEIWQIGDAENRGLLTPAGFSAVLRLIGHCQAGRSPDLDLAKQPGPLPRFDGITLPGQAAQTPQAPPARVPPLSPDKVNEYASLFDKTGAQNGLLAGDSAIQIFRNSRLSNDVLGQVWGLADRDARGSLNQTEFVVAMHLLASMRTGSMKAVPPTLPQGLWDAAARRAVPPPPTSIPRQFTGPQRTQSPLARQAFPAPPPAAQSTGSDWLITPQDKSHFDAQFSTLDKQGRGYITGDQAVQFFSTSRLDEDTLATIWDLSDINSEGQLSRDEFAVAMYLIRQERSKTTGRGQLPATLPPRLVPPSMRKQAQAPSQTTAPTFDNAANAPAQPKSAADDLFGLDALSETPQKPAAPSVQDPFANDRPTSPSSPQSATQPRSAPLGGTQFKPFQPTSSFGQGLAVQNTGGSVGSNQSSARGAPQAGGAHDDLLGDTDPEVNKRFNSETTELANMSNQIGTLRTQMQEAQTKRGGHEREIASASSQKKELESRLAQFRTQYEQEVREVRSLEERLTASREETKNLSDSLAMLEGQSADLRNQHQQLSQAFEADQRENMQLKERTSQLNAEIAQLKPALEKLRNDARQQKGMVAINKKQVSTSEGERDKMTSERGELEKSISDSRAQSPEASRDISSPMASRDISSPIASPPAGVASPAASTGSQSMNPFFRKSSSMSVDRTAGSPKPDYSSTPGAGAAAFESFFGPSDPTSKPSMPPPPTTFSNASQQNLENSSEGASTPRSGMQTPPRDISRSLMSDTPGPGEPPAPPESRQITSSSLPFRPGHLRTESPASASVRVHPPASRSAMSDLEGPPTPGTTSAATSTNGDETPSRSIPAAAAAPVAAAAATAASHRPTTERIQSSDSHHIPGSFPGEVDSPSRSTPTGGSTTSLNEAANREAPQQSGTAASQGGQLSNAHDDFDSMFANAGLQNASAAQSRDPFATSNGKGKNRAESEFPPIQDVEADDSDSSSEGGFEDSFASAGQHQQQPQHQAPTAGVLNAERPPFKSANSAASSLPTPDAQRSPPTYESSQPPSDNVHLPKQYEGLVPQRQASNSSPETTMQSPPASMSHVTSQRSGSLANHDTMPVSSELKQVASDVPDKTGGHDDFDDAFNDLDEAKEGDGEDFGESGHAQSGNDFDFNNPQFSSPANTSRANTFSSSIQHTPTGSTLPTNVSNVERSTETHPFGQSADSPFGASSSSNAQAGSSSNLPTSMSSSNHDWDAIFSGLDKPVDSSVSSNGPIQEGKSPFAPAESSAAAAATPSSAQSPPGTSQGGSGGLQPPQQRPSVARAISTGTEHDDPILKSLTGMGYSREKALAALEKYDYNLDKAADYLTSGK